MKKFLVVVLTAVFLLGFAGISMAKVEYTASNNGGGNYTLNFKVFNEWVEDIEWLSVYFGQTTDGLNFANTDEFSNFSPDETGVGPETQPASWDSYSFEPSAIDNPGQFNSELFSGSGIAPGGSLGGFTVSFDWTGVGSYDHLFYEVGNFDVAGGYAYLGEGYTEMGGQGQEPIPEPATMTLLGAGLVGLGFFRRKKK